MTRNEIIAHAKALTRNRSEGKDLNHEVIFINRLQQICTQKHWWFRRKYIAITLEPGVKEYDLTSTDINADNDVAEISKVFYVEGTDKVQLDPIADDIEQVIAAESDESGEPANYFIKPGTTWTLCVTPTPASAKTLYVIYWASPTNTETSEDEVPILPGHLHHLLVLGMEMDLEGYLAGTESVARYEIAVKKYEEALFMAQGQPFATAETQRQVIVRGSSVRST